MSSNYTPPRSRKISQQQQQDYDSLAEHIEREEGVRPGLLRALISQESGYNPRAVSPKGATGLGQLMPATAKRFGVVDSKDPEQNLRGSAKYLKFLDNRYGGDLDKIYAGYNAGEGNVDKYGGIPPFRETQDYVPKVKANYARITGQQQQQPQQPQFQQASYDPDDPEEFLKQLRSGTASQQEAIPVQDDEPEDPEEFLAKLRLRSQTQPKPSQAPAINRPAKKTDRVLDQIVPNTARAGKPQGERFGDLLARQFGFSDRELQAYKDKLKVEPFANYNLANYDKTKPLAAQVQNSDPGLYAALNTFLKQEREKGSLPESKATAAQPQGLVDTFVAPTAAGQRQRGAVAGSALNALTFGNLNRIQRPFTGADIPEPEQVRAKVVQGIDGKPVEVYDEEANPEGSAFAEIASPENVAGLLGNLAGFTGIAKGLAAAGGKVAATAAQGSKIARAGQILASEAANVTRLENAGKTAALFGTAGALANPDPEGKMAFADELAKRLEQGVTSGATGYVSGVLAGVNPTVLREMLTFTIPQGLKTAIEGYLAGRPYEDIERDVTKEAVSNLLLPLVFRAGEVGRNPIEAPANEAPPKQTEEFAQNTRAAAREFLGELNEPIGVAPGAPPPMNPEQLAAQETALRTELSDIFKRGAKTPEDQARVEAIAQELDQIKATKTVSRPTVDTNEPIINAKPAEPVKQVRELVPEELTANIADLENKLKTSPPYKMETAEMRKRLQDLKAEQARRATQPAEIEKPIEAERAPAQDLDTKLSELDRQIKDEESNMALLNDDALLGQSIDRYKALVDDYERLKVQREKLSNVAIKEPVKPASPEPLPEQKVKQEPKRVIFDDAGNTRSYGEVERLNIEGTAKALGLKPEQTKRITDIQRQFTTDPITGFEIPEYIQPTLEAARLNDKPGSYAKLEVVNLGGANGSFGNPLASNDVIGKYADIVKAELEPLNKFGGKVNLFRGKGGQIEVVASGVEPVLLEKTLKRAQERINREVVVASGLDKLASPKLKGAKAKQAEDPQEYIKTVGKSGGGLQFVVEGINNRSSANEIRETTAKRLEESYIERAKNVDEAAFVEGIRPVRPSRDAEPSYLSRESKPVELGENFATPEQLLRKEFNELAKELSPKQAKALQPLVEKLLLKDTLLGKYGFLGASEREFTARRAAEYTDQTNEPSFYAEFDFRNVGGLNKIGEKFADGVLEQFGKIISENLQKLSSKTASVSLFRHGGDEVSAIITGADRATIQTAIDKATIEIDNYVKGEKLENLPHPKGSLPGTGIIGAVAKFEPLNQNKPLSMQERVEEVLGRAGSEIEDIKVDLKKQYEAQKAAREVQKEVTDGQRGEIGKTGASTPSRRSRSTTSSAEGKNTGLRSESEGVRGSESERPRSAAPSVTSQDTNGSTDQSGRGDGSTGEPATTVDGQPTTEATEVAPKLDFSQAQWTMSHLDNLIESPYVPFVANELKERVLSKINESRQAILDTGFELRGGSGSGAIEALNSLRGSLTGALSRLARLSKRVETNTNKPTEAKERLPQAQERLEQLLATPLEPLIAQAKQDAINRKPPGEVMTPEKYKAIQAAKEAELAQFAREQQIKKIVDELNTGEVKLNLGQDNQTVQDTANKLRIFASKRGYTLNDPVFSKKRKSWVMKVAEFPKKAEETKPTEAETKQLESKPISNKIESFREEVLQTTSLESANPKDLANYLKQLNKTVDALSKPYENERTGYKTPPIPPELIKAYAEEARLVETLLNNNVTTPPPSEPPPTPPNTPPTPAGSKAIEASNRTNAKDISKIEPWRLTQNEFINQVKEGKITFKLFGASKYTASDLVHTKDFKTLEKIAKDRHEGEVVAAFVEGKDVLPEAAESYPEIYKKLLERKAEAKPSEPTKAQQPKPNVEAISKATGQPIEKVEKILKNLKEREKQKLIKQEKERLAYYEERLSNVSDEVSRRVTLEEIEESKARLAKLEEQAKPVEIEQIKRTEPAKTEQIEEKVAPRSRPDAKSFSSKEDYEKALRTYYENKTIDNVWKEYLTQKSAKVELAKAKSALPDKNWAIEKLENVPNNDGDRYRIVAYEQADEAYINKQVDWSLKAYDKQRSTASATPSSEPGKYVDAGIGGQRFEPAYGTPEHKAWMEAKAKRIEAFSEAYDNAKSKKEPWELTKYEYSLRAQKPNGMIDYEKIYSPETFALQDKLNEATKRGDAVGAKQYRKQFEETSKKDFDAYYEKHKNAIKEAIAEGKEVRPDILEEYLDLKPNETAKEPVTPVAEPTKENTKTLTEKEEVYQAIARAQKENPDDGINISEPIKVKDFSIVQDYNGDWLIENSQGKQLGFTRADNPKRAYDKYRPIPLDDLFVGKIPRQTPAVDDVKRATFENAAKEHKEKLDAYDTEIEKYGSKLAKETNRSRQNTLREKINQIRDDRYQAEKAYSEGKGEVIKRMYLEDKATDPSTDIVKRLKALDDLKLLPQDVRPYDIIKPLQELELPKPEKIVQQNYAQEGDLISDGFVLLDKTALEGKFRDLNPKKASTQGRNPSRNPSQEKLREIIDGFSGKSQDAEIIGYLTPEKENASPIAYIKTTNSQGKELVTGVNATYLKFATDAMRANGLKANDSAVVLYKDSKPVGVIMNMRSDGIPLLNAKLAKEVVEARKAELLLTNTQQPDASIEKYSKGYRTSDNTVFTGKGSKEKAEQYAKENPLKPQTLYQENIDPDKLVAPDGVSRRKLWTVLATHGLKDENGKTMGYKQAIETTDKVLYLMDTFARSTGKDVDTWYKETFSNAISEKMLKADGKVNAKGATEFLKNGQAVLRLFEGADASTLVHESFHIFRQQLTPEENANLGRWLQASGLGEVKDGKFSNAQEEYIARAGENYLRKGELPEAAPSMLKQVFNSFGGWIKGIYDRLQANGKIKIPFGNKIKKFFDEVQFDEQARAVFEQRFIRGAKGYEEVLRPSGDTIGGNISTRKADVRASGEGLPRSLTPTLPDGSNRPMGNASNYSLTGSGEAKTRSVPESARPYLDPELSKRVPEQQYNTLTNSQTEAAARDLISRKPDDALAMATGDRSDPLSNEIAIQMLSKSQAEGNFSQARQIIDALARRSTEAGQAIQILSRISNASPEGIVRYAERVLEKEAGKIPTAIRNQADKISKELTNLVEALEATAPVKEALIRFFQKNYPASKLRDKVLTAVAKQPTRERQLQAINDVVSKHYGIASLNDAVAQQLYDLSKLAQTQTGYDQQRTNARIAKLIGEQIKATTGNKLNFLLRAADLFNPSGALLNTVSDVAYSSPLGIETGVDVLASGLDRAGKALGIFKQRSLAAPDVGAQLKDFKTNLDNVKNEIVEGIDTDNVTEKKLGLPSSTPFNNVIARAVDKSIRFGYGWTQTASLRTAKAESLRNQMKVAEMNGQKLSEPTNEMIERAELEAAQRAMLDNNFVSTALTGIRKSLNRLSTGGKSEEFGLGSILLTYTQVPGALLKRGIEFSPLGFAKVGYQMFKAAKYKEFDQRKFVKDFSRAIIGTGVTLGMAALLHQIGVLQNPTEDDDEGRLRRIQGDEGINTYRLNIDAFVRYAGTGFQDINAAKAQKGDKLVNYEFMQPLGFLLNFGANLNENKQKAAKGEAVGAWHGAKALASAGINTLSDAPLIRSLVDASRLAEKDKQGSYGTALVKSLVTRPVPALVRQARNYLDNTKRLTDDPESFEQSLINMLKDSVPGYSKDLPAQKTTFGEDKQRITGGGGFVDSFVLGGKVNTYDSTKEGEKAKEIFIARRPEKGRDSHIPSSPNELKVNGEQRKLTSKEKSNYQEYLGKASKSIYEFAEESDVFNKLDPEKQGKVLSKYIDREKDKAKIQVLDDNPKDKIKILKRPTMPSKEIFEHNLEVDSKVDDVIDQLQTNQRWAELYKQLSPMQQKHAESQINSLFNKARIEEYNNKLAVVQKAEANAAKLMFKAIKPGIEVPVILRAAKYWKEE